jgi:hypothetical protein
LAAIVLAAGCQALDLWAKRHAPPSAGGDGERVAPPGAETVAGLLPPPFDAIALAALGAAPTAAAWWLAIRGRRRTAAALETVTGGLEEAEPGAAAAVKAMVRRRMDFMPGGRGGAEATRLDREIEQAKARARNRARTRRSNPGV